MTLPTRATSAASTPWSIAVPGDLASASSRSTGPVFSALLDMHAQAAPGSPNGASTRQPAPPLTARQPAPPAPPKQPTPANATAPASSPPATAQAGDPSSAPPASMAAAKTAAAAYQARQAADKEAARALAARSTAPGASEATAAHIAADGNTATDATPQDEAASPATGADAALQAWLGWQPPPARADAASGASLVSGELSTDPQAQDTSATLEGRAGAVNEKRSLEKDADSRGLWAGTDSRSDAASLHALPASTGPAAAAGEDSASGAVAADSDIEGIRPSLEGLSPGQALAHTPAEARGTAHATPPASVSLGTGPGQADFAETFALQVSQLAQSGIQEATLHLNPADLGSIAVQISVDAGQAQVDFSASSAHTRELLGSQLEVLAQALQSAGLSMTGGQVRDPSQGGSQDARHGASGRGASGGRVQPGDATAADAPTRTLQVAAGRLDLFA